MSYKINLEAFSGIYALPASVVDKHLKLSGAIQLKVLLLGLRNPSDIDEQKIANALSVPVPDVVDALNYWADLGVLQNREAETPVAEVKPQETDVLQKKKIAPAKPVKPTREEVARRGNESPEVAALLREAQIRFSRNLTYSETSTLVWLYDDEGMDPMLLLWLISYAKSEGKNNIGFIEKTAIQWNNEGVVSVADAEKKVQQINERRSSWFMVEKAMGIPHRMPSKNEEKMAYTWICEYGYTVDILRKAYDACIDATSGFSMPYIKKILEGWHKAGVKNMSDLARHLEDDTKAKPKKKSGMETFDMNQFNKVLNDLPE